MVATKPNLWTDDGSEVNNIDMDNALTELGLSHTVAQKDVPKSNSMIEAVFRLIKKYYFEYEYHDDDKVMIDKIEWLADDYNNVRPHSAHKHKQTPNQSFEEIMPDLGKIAEKAASARAKRKASNLKVLCSRCT